MDKYSLRVSLGRCETVKFAPLYSKPDSAIVGQVWPKTQIYDRLSCSNDSALLASQEYSANRRALIILE